MRALRKKLAQSQLTLVTFVLLLGTAVLTGCGSDNNPASNNNGSGTSNTGGSNPGNSGGNGGSSGGSGGGTSTTPGFAYVGNYDQRINGYQVNGTDGGLTEVTGSPFQQGSAVADMVLADSTIVTVNYDGDLTPWSIDATTGALSKGTVVSGDYSWLAANGSNIYASSSGGVTSFSASNGTVTQVGSTSSLADLCKDCMPTTLRTSADGKYVFAFVSGFYDVNGFAILDRAASGEATNPRLTGVNNSTFPYDDEIVSPDNKWIYELTQEKLRQYQLDPVTGKTTVVNQSAASTGNGGDWGQFSPDGKYLLVVNDIGNSISVFSYDAATGALTQVTGSPFPTGNRPLRFAFDSTGKYVYVICTAQGTADLFGYKLDASTGALMQVAHQSIGGDPRGVAVK
jgi:6-phosphogluconolactonase